jgi:Ribonucleotide reductase, barrel domain
MPGRTRMQVRKRNGDTEPVDVNKIVRAVGRCAGELGDIDPLRVATKTIYHRYAQVARLSKFAGGIGISWSRVRSRGALIRGTNGQSNGIVPWLRTLDASVAAVNQGGRRKGAACVYLEPWHPDIEEFLELRDNTGEDARGPAGNVGRLAGQGIRRQVAHRRVGIVDHDLVAPPASAPSAFTSARSSRRPAAASGPSPTHWAQSTTPAVPSMSLDRKIFMLVLFPGSRRSRRRR